MEAIILAGGKAERLGAAAGGRPKALVPVAGRPLAAYQVALLASAGVERVIVSCSAGRRTSSPPRSRVSGPRSSRRRSPSRWVAAAGFASRPQRGAKAATSSR
jgi:molybdopterin-guanine dinucleotide biosynthesis protein A